MTANQEKQRRHLASKTWHGNRPPTPADIPANAAWSLAAPTEAQVERAERLGRKLAKQLSANQPKMNLRNYNHAWDWSHLERIE